MYRGINAINMDTKGRIAVPSRYREELSSKFDGELVVTIDTDQPCLLLYPLSEWEIIEAKIQALPSFQPATRRIQRLLIGHATEVQLDKLGRFLIPPLLREYSHLDKKVMIVGQGNKFEIWSDDEWQQGRETWLAEAKTMTGDNLPEELSDLAL